MVMGDQEEALQPVASDTLILSCSVFETSQVRMFIKPRCTLSKGSHTLFPSTLFCLSLSGSRGGWSLPRRVHPGQVAGLSQGQHAETDNHSHSHTVFPFKSISSATV